MEQHIESQPEKMYELTALLRNEEFSPVKKLLEKHGVVLIEERPLEKTHLSYPILKEHFVFQGVCYFTMPEGTISALGNDLNLEGEVVRYIIRSVKHVGEKAETERGSGLNREARRFNVSREGRKPETQTLTNEAL